MAREKTFGCPVEVTLSVIGGRWKSVILWWLRAETLRFSELRRKIPRITEKMLAQQLRELEAHGIVSRTVFPVVPPKVEYALTPYGKTLAPISEAMCHWAKKHLRRTKS